MKFLLNASVLLWSVSPNAKVSWKSVAHKRFGSPSQYPDVR